MSVSKLSLLFCLLVLLVSAAKASDAQNQFFDNLRAVCGERFVGEMTFPVDDKSDFAGKRLTAHIADCSENEVRVPFMVGDDSSRTWVFSRTAAGLQLKHDHRHADGSADKISQYGGIADNTGTALRQSFAADLYTKELIPQAATNVWTVSISDDGAKVIYHLERHGAARFTAVLRQSVE